MSKTTLSLSQIFDSHIPKGEEIYTKQYGFLLIISLSKAEEKTSSNGGITLSVNNGYITTSDKFGPFLNTWRGFGINYEENKCVFKEYDSVGRNLADPALAEKYKSTPINWRINLPPSAISRMLGEEGLSGHKAYKQLCKKVLDSQKVQLQVLAVKGVGNQVDPGKFRTAKLRSGKGVDVYDITLTNQDIFSMKLVFPGNDFIAKVDRPSSVMKQLEGRLIDWDKAEAIEVVDPFAGLKVTQVAQASVVQASSQEAVPSTSVVGSVAPDDGDDDLQINM